MSFSVVPLLGIGRDDLRRGDGNEAPAHLWITQKHDPNVNMPKLPEAQIDTIKFLAHRSARRKGRKKVNLQRSLIVIFIYLSALLLPCIIRKVWLRKSFPRTNTFALTLAVDPCLEYSEVEL